MRLIAIAAALVLPAAVLFLGPGRAAHADLFFSEDDAAAGHIAANGHGNVVVLPPVVDAHIPHP